MFKILTLSSFIASTSAVDVCGWHADAAGTGWVADDCGSKGICCTTDALGSVPVKAKACMTGLVPQDAPWTHAPFTGPFDDKKHWCCAGDPTRAPDNNNCELAGQREAVKKPDKCPPNSMKCTSASCEKIPSGKMCHEKKWIDKTCDTVYKLLMAKDGVSVADRCGTVTWTDKNPDKTKYVSYKIGNKFSKGKSYSPVYSRLECYEKTLDAGGNYELVVAATGSDDGKATLGPECVAPNWNVNKDGTYGNCMFPTCAKMKLYNMNVKCTADCPGLSYNKDIMAKFYPKNKCPCDNLTPKEQGVPDKNSSDDGDDDGLGIVPIIAIAAVVLFIVFGVVKYVQKRNKAKANDGLEFTASSGSYNEWDGEKKPGFFGKIFGRKTKSVEKSQEESFIPPTQDTVTA